MAACGPFSWEAIPPDRCSLADAREWSTWLEEPPFPQKKMLHDGAQRERREEGERANDDYCTYQQADKQWPVRRQSSAGYRHTLLCGQATRGGQHRDDDQEPSDQHGQPRCQVVPGCVGVNAGEGTAVISSAAAIGVQDLSQSMRTPVVQIANAWPIRTIPV